MIETLVIYHKEIDKLTKIEIKENATGPSNLYDVNQISKISSYTLQILGQAISNHYCGYYYTSKYTKHNSDKLSIDILKIKQGDTAAAHRIAILMRSFAKKINPSLLQCDLIIPVPNYKNDHPKISRAVLLGDSFYNVLKNTKHIIEFAPDALEKTMETLNHKQMKRAEREQFFKENTVYRFSGKDNVSGKSILLIDDVLTTGHTLQQCIKQLLDNGAEKIYTFCAGYTYMVDF